jgi:hypothetical protein
VELFQRQPQLQVLFVLLGAGAGPEDQKGQPPTIGDEHKDCHPRINHEDATSKADSIPAVRATRFTVADRLDGIRRVVHLPLYGVVNVVVVVGIVVVVVVVVSPNVIDCLEDQLRGGIVEQRSCCHRGVFGPCQLRKHVLPVGPDPVRVPHPSHQVNGVGIASPRSIG